MTITPNTVIRKTLNPEAFAIFRKYGVASHLSRCNTIKELATYCNIEMYDLIRDLNEVVKESIGGARSSLSKSP